MSGREEILPLFPPGIRELLSAAEVDFAGLREIRVRVNQPVILRSGAGGEMFLWRKEEENAGKRERYDWAESGKATVIRSGTFGRSVQAEPAGGKPQRMPYRATAQDVRDTVELISRHSLYAFEEDVKRGFLTVPGGHRVGIAGRVVMDGGHVAALRNISFLNIRISHEVPGCGEEFLSYIRRDTGDLYHTLILSGPGGGKTTLLRDLVRLLSYGGQNISVIDERSEIAACYQGIPENDLGPRTDVLDGCPKAVGCRMALRSLAPDILAVDELGGRDELEALSEVTACGCRIIATMHANGLGELLAKPFFKEMWERKTFERFLVRIPSVPVGRRGGWRVADENGAWIL